MIDIFFLLVGEKGGLSLGFRLDGKWQVGGLPLVKPTPKIGGQVVRLEIDCSDALLLLFD